VKGYMVGNNIAMYEMLPVSEEITPLGETHMKK
jgi:hypothetical protein